MSWKIGMPNLGHTMEEGKVSEWLKRIGDPVTQGEVIAVVESDKASFDVESPADGVLIAINVEGGETVVVGATIGLVGAPGESAAPKTPAPLLAAAAAIQAGASGPEAAPGNIPAAVGRAGRLKISPAARALAEDLGIDPAAVTGTGDDGMVSRDDVRVYAAARAAPCAPAESLAKPLSPMRRAIAEATQRAWQSIPHVALHSHADVGALIEGGASLTASVASACALALGAYPAFNGWLVDNAFEHSPKVNLAFAVATPDGLVAAVVPEAETKSVAELGDALQVLATSARAGRLAGAHMLGGSFTISSLGRWGVDVFAPIISAPQVAILGVGRINRVAREAVGGGIRFASEIQLTLVFDHRANDGVQAAQLLAAIVGHLENPQRLEVKT